MEEGIVRLKVLSLVLKVVARDLKMLSDFLLKTLAQLPGGQQRALQRLLGRGEVHQLPAGMGCNAGPVAMP